MRTKPLLLLSLACAAPLLAFADWPAGTLIYPAVYIDILPATFETLEDVVVDFLPESINVPGIEDGGEVEVLGFDVVSWEYGVTDINVFLEATNIDIRPATDTIDLNISLQAEIGRPDQRIRVYADADLLEFISIGQDCSIYIDPLVINVTGGINLVFDGMGGVDATVDGLTYEIPLNEGVFNSSGCFLGDVLEAVDYVLAEFLGTDGGLIGLILGFVTPEIDAQLQAIVPEIETAIEDGFALLNVSESFDLLGVSLAVDVFPTDFFVRPEGLRLQLDGSFSAGTYPHPCVSRYDLGLSRQTIPNIDPRYPTLGEGAAGFNHHVGAMVNDDFANQALYEVWRGGLLCQTISSESSAIDLPIPINASLLTLLAAGEFDELFESDAPAILRTRPEQPPILRTDGPHTADIDVEKLGLDIYTILDGRYTRAVGLDLSTSAGIDVGFAPTTGQLTVDIAFSPEDIAAQVVFNDLKPSASEKVQSGFSSLAETLVAPLLGEALSGFSFDLPAIEGLGLADARVDGAGPIEDFIGVFGTIGQVPYGDASGGTGCEGLDAGCDTGCSAGGRGPGTAPGLMLLAAAALLRRRRA
jgi:uncharacterized protein (TIGR03382 family)